MPKDALETFVERVRGAWGPLTTGLVAACQDHARDLLATPASDPWLETLRRTRPATRALYRDPEHGFVLLAHAEHAGLYRPPHDHGRGWVIYAMYEGAIEMRTFARVDAQDGPARLVQRDSTVVRAGGVQLNMPGDIHDTRCLSETALLLRFTARDLAIEDRVEHRVTRYAEPKDAWSRAAR